MSKTEIVVVGHCTDTTAKIFYCVPEAGTPPLRARLQWRSAQASDSAEIVLERKRPYHMGVFRLENLPASGVLEYAINRWNEGSTPPLVVFPSQGIHKVRLPPADRPLRVALLSCNGTFNYAPEDRRRNLLWRALAEEIRQGRVDLVIHCGDQIYADPIWEKHDSHARNRGLTANSNSRIDALTSEYRRWYVMTWSDPDVAEVLSSAPNVMTWDDHDIYDGYGSNNDDDQPASHAFFKAAETAFTDFQTSHGPPPIQGSSGYLRALVYGELGILILDTRTNRMWKRRTVLGEKQLDAVAQWLLQRQSRLRHLYVVSSIPIVHARVAGSVRLLDLLPGELAVEDDLKDAWTATNNAQECHRLLKRLFVHQARNPETLITVLSGDVHVGTIGELRTELPLMSSGSRRVYQVTASGIGTPPPQGIVLWLVKLGTSGNWIELGSPDFRGRLIRMGGVDDVILARRNFAVLDPGDKAGVELEPHGNLQVTFFTEDPTSEKPLRLSQVLNGPGRRPATPASPGAASSLATPNPPGAG